MGWRLYKSILLERAGMTVAERRAQLVLLESYQLQFQALCVFYYLLGLRIKRLRLLSLMKIVIAVLLQKLENKMDLLKNKIMH